MVALRWRRDTEPDWAEAEPHQLSRPLEDGSPGLRARVEISLQLQPGRALIWQGKSIDYHAPSDSVTILFNYPTDSPRVEVDVPTGMEGTVRFPHLSDESVACVDGVHTFDGVLLPDAALVVRWWETAAAAG